VTRVALVHQPIDGGVARHVLDLFDGLTGLGFEPVLCGPAVPSASSLRNGTRRAVPHARLAMKRAVAPGWDAIALGSYARVVGSIKPQLVHAHSSKAGALARIGKLVHPRIPVLYTPHGYAFAGYNERPLQRRLYREAERSLVPLTRCVIAVCQAEAALARSLSAGGWVHVVHNGIDPPPDAAADPRIAELSRRGTVLCTLTQLRPGKGVETLIDALPPVIERHPDLQVAIIGGGPLKGALQSRARLRGVEHRVHFLGEQGDPVAMLRGADAFVLPSWAEAFPYAILEAMSVGLPIVSSDVGGIAEAIEHGTSGLLVRPADVPGTARALLELLDDERLRVRLGEAARRIVSERFTRLQMVERVASVYEQVLSARGRS
jgi:glycosyltransferase involved in cell wall biosynthesis